MQLNYYNTLILSLLRIASDLSLKAKYLNNIVESDHGKLKRLIKPTLGFKSMKTGYATIKGFETFRMFRKHQFDEWCQFPENLKDRLKGEIRALRIFAWVRLNLYILARFKN